MAMEVGSSSGSASVRVVKPADMASSSRGSVAIESTPVSSSEEDDPFHRSDSVPRLEDLIAGDSRLEELFNGDAEAQGAKQSAGDTEDEDEDDFSGISARCESGHTLRFLAVAPYLTSAFVCNRCSARETGEVFHCESCLFDLCPSCARAPTEPLLSQSPLVSSSSSPMHEIPSSWGQPLLGCMDRNHALEVLESAPYESGAYMCNLCLKTGDAAVYHCTSCTDFDLHPECANITREIASFTHPHQLLLQPPYSRGHNTICDGCLEGLGGSQWVYRCSNSGCDFDLHARCAKYARTISHPIHEEHELVLVNESTPGRPHSVVMCDACEAQVDPKELVYNCRECGFDIHPICAIGEVVRI